MDLRFVCFNSKWQCWWLNGCGPIGYWLGRGGWMGCTRAHEQFVSKWMTIRIRSRGKWETHRKHICKLIWYGLVMTNNHVNVWWIHSIGAWCYPPASPHLAYIWFGLQCIWNDRRSENLLNQNWFSSEIMLQFLINHSNRIKVMCGLDIGLLQRLTPRI